MFQKNDLSLLLAKLLLKSFCILIAIACVVLAIIAENIGFDQFMPPIVLILIAVIVIPIIYFMSLLKLNYYCDIKLIRNKLYELDNSNLETFFKDNVEEEPQEDFQENSEEDFQDDNNDIPNAL